MVRKHKSTFQPLLTTKTGFRALQAGLKHTFHLSLFPKSLCGVRLGQFNVEGVVAA